MIPASAANRESGWPWEHRRASPGRGGRRPGTLLAKVLLLLAQSPEPLGSSTGIRPMEAQSRPAELCQVHSWTLSAAVSLLFQCFFSPNFKYHFALDSLQIFPLRCLPGGVPLHPKGSPELGLTPPLLWRSLTRYPPNFRTKCLLSQLPPPLEEFCCIRKIWRSHINALLLLKVLITLKASFAPVW